MNVTKKFIYTLVGATVILSLAGIVQIAVPAFIVINVILVVMLIVDYKQTTGEHMLEIKRIGIEKLSINEKEEILFEVWNKGREALQIELVDEVPEFHFEVSNPVMSLTIEPHTKKEVGYEIIPRKRGAFEFGNLHIKLRSKRGFLNKYFKRDIKREYKVYPNLKALKKYRLSLYKNTLEREERKSVKLHKNGTAFESLREYVVGDEYKKINWMASARSNKLIVNQYEPEKNQRVYMFIDSGRPMSYTLKDECKLDRAINTSLVLADIVGQNGDLSGIIGFNTEIQSVVAPGKGMAHRNKIMEALYHLDTTNLTSNYDVAFEYFRTKEKHKSIIFLFTDFDTLEEAEILAQAAGVVEKNHLLVIILLRDEKLEALAQNEAKTEEELYQKAVAIESLQNRKIAIRKLNNRNIMCIQCLPEQVELTVINSYIRVKNKLQM